MPQGFSSFSSSSEITSSTNATQEFWNTAAKINASEQAFRGDDDMTTRSSTGVSMIHSEGWSSSETYTPTPVKKLAPVDLVSLVKREFPAIDQDRDGALDMIELARSRAAASQSTRDAATIVFDKAFLHLDSPNFGRFDRDVLNGWQQAVEAHDSPSFRRQELYRSTGIGALLGAGTLGLSGAITRAMFGAIGSEAAWVLPLACTLAGAIGGGYLGNRMGHAQLHDWEVQYKSLL